MTICFDHVRYQTSVKYRKKEPMSRMSQTGRVDLYHGDCRDMLKSMPDCSADLIVSSPPYSMGREYESRSAGLEEFRKLHEIIFADMYRILKPSGSICWQVGSYASDAFRFRDIQHVHTDGEPV